MTVSDRQLECGLGFHTLFVELVGVIETFVKIRS
jgi:hypothetical protein